MMEDPRNIYRATRVQSITKSSSASATTPPTWQRWSCSWSRARTSATSGGSRRPGGNRVPHGVLFLCVQNSARSQMAEGWARKLLPSGVRIWSAGSQPAAGVHPYAARVMQEVGIDISSQRPKPLSHVPLGDIDTVIMLCDDECPIPPADRRRREESWHLADPGEVAGSEQDMLLGVPPRPRRDQDAHRTTRGLAAPPRKRRRGSLYAQCWPNGFGGSDRKYAQSARRSTVVHRAQHGDRHERIERLAVALDAGVEQAHEVGLGVELDAGLVRRDVRRHRQIGRRARDRTAAEAVAVAALAQPRELGAVLRRRCGLERLRPQFSWSMRRAMSSGSMPTRSITLPTTPTVDRAACDRPAARCARTRRSPSGRRPATSSCLARA